jgi:hypothetical protein
MDIGVQEAVSITGRPDKLGFYPTGSKDCLKRIKK